MRGHVSVLQDRKQLPGLDPLQPAQLRVAARLTSPGRPSTEEAGKGCVICCERGGGGGQREEAEVLASSTELEEGSPQQAEGAGFQAASSAPSAPSAPGPAQDGAFVQRLDPGRTWHPAPLTVVCATLSPIGLHLNCCHFTHRGIGMKFGF